jgi:hypothetical protein
LIIVITKFCQIEVNSSSKKLNYFRHPQIKE